MENKHNNKKSGSGYSKFFTLLKKTYKEWKEDDPFRQSAVIAYYSIFSMPALLVIIIALAGFFFGNEAVTGQLSSQISGMMGKKTAEQVEDMIANASIGNKSIWATIIAVITLILGATGVFIQLQKSLNMIWEVEVELPQKRSFGNKIVLYLRKRLLSFGIVLSIGFLLLVSLVITSMLSLFSNWLEARFPDIAIVLLYVVNFIISLGLIT
ncbi:MAG: YihY/virulence factor BrkB family protein, partial [Fimbriimonadaceae bacterium]|nr:YihY/virulence factor BrkB family protein [Chitinophagales bacterium]